MKMLFWDVDDTLYLRSEPFIKACEEVLDFKMDFDELYVRRTYYSDLLLDDCDAGLMSLEMMQYLRLQKALEEFGHSTTMEEAMRFEEAYNRHKEHIVLDKRFEVLLEKLKQNNIPMTIITNGNSKNQRGKGKALELERYSAEDMWIISGEVGHNKPDIRIFNKAMELTGSDPDECYIVGDNYEVDIVGASKAKWHTIWYNHRHNKAGEYQPDYEVNDLDSLVGLIEKLFLGV